MSGTSQSVQGFDINEVVGITDRLSELRFALEQQLPDSPVLPLLVGLLGENEAEMTGPLQLLILDMMRDEQREGAKCVG